MEKPGNGVLKIYAAGPGSADEAGKFLTSISLVYKTLIFLDRFATYDQRGEPQPLGSDANVHIWLYGRLFNVADLRTTRGEFVTLSWLFSEFKKFEPETVPENSFKELQIKAIQFNSPGWIELVGSLNPIEQLRKYLCERHERIKDKTYRNANEDRIEKAKAEALELLNLKETVALLESAGFPEEEIQMFIRQKLHIPLKYIANYPITQVEVVPEAAIYNKTQSEIKQADGDDYVLATE